LTEKIMGAEGKGSMEAQGEGLQRKGKSHSDISYLKKKELNKQKRRGYRDIVQRSGGITSKRQKRTKKKKTLPNNLPSAQIGRD